MAHAVTMSLVWIAALTMVAGSLAVRKYRRG